MDAPCAKLLGLASNFATLVNLRTLSFSINPAHAPGTPPMPLVPVCPSSMPTPCGTPEMNRDLHLPQIHNGDHPSSQASISANDPSMPLMRDVKRFVRKCPKLQILGMRLRVFEILEKYSDLPFQSGLVNLGVAHGP